MACVCVWIRTVICFTNGGRIIVTTLILFGVCEAFSFSVFSFVFVQRKGTREGRSWVGVLLPGLSRQGPCTSVL